MRNIEIAKSLIEQGIRDDRPVLIYGDPDCDGIISLLLVSQFLDERNARYSYYVNENRHHGFTLDASGLHNCLIIAVDFELKLNYLQELADNDCLVVSLDHHEIRDEEIVIRDSDGDVRAVVLNNQYPFEPEEDRYQSGAGVVYEAFVQMFPEFKSKEREALVGITLLSDARPIENKKARAYLKTLYNSNAQEGYLGYLVSSVIESDFGFGLPQLDRNFIDYTFSPTINSLLRFGYEAETVEFILGKGLTVMGTRDRQRQLLQVMKQRSSYLDLPNLTVIALDENAITEFGKVSLDNFIGLMCNDVKGTGKSVLGFTYKDGKIHRASFRGRYDDVKYRELLCSMGLDAQGHASAFGILNFSPTKELWLDLSSRIGEVELSHVQTTTVVNTSNLSFTMLQKGLSIATENCYVRDMYRTYLRYTGSKAVVVKQTYKTEPFSDEDYAKGVKPDKTIEGVPHKFVVDACGNKIPKYIEYLVDGQQVKSFGVGIKEGVILPMLEKGRVQLYVREAVS